jgi:hypothetical protein
MLRSTAQGIQLCVPVLAALKDFAHAPRHLAALAHAPSQHAHADSQHAVDLPTLLRPRLAATQGPSATSAAFGPLPHQVAPHLQLLPHLARPASTVAFPLAQTGEGISECELLQWFAKEGDLIEEFDRLCEVQSDKVRGPTVPKAIFAWQTWSPLL